MEAFKPVVDKEHKYAVAISAEGGIVAPIQSYATLELLKEGYLNWLKFAVERSITKPCPIEFLDKSGKCRILIDIIKECT